MNVGRYLRSLTLAAVVLAIALVALPGQVRTASAAPAPSGRIGTSCIVATSTDLTSVTNSTSSTVTFRLKCNWSPADQPGTTSNGKRQAMPFASCLATAPFTCTPASSAPTRLDFQEYTGTVGSTDPTQRHGASSRGVLCNVNASSWTQTIGTLTGEWSWRCSSMTNWFGGNNAVLENATILSNGSAPVGFSGVGLGGTSGLDGNASGFPWLGSLDRVTNAAFSVAQPQYTWSPAPACEQLRMFIANPGRTIAPGGTINASFLDGWDAVMASSTVLLRYRWSPVDDWTEFYNAATAGGLIPSTQTFTNNTGGPRTGVTLEVHCAGAGGRYIRGDNSEGGVTPQAMRPCAALTVGWPDEGLYDALELVWIDLEVGSGTTGTITSIDVRGGRFGNEQSVTVGDVVDADSITFLDPDGDTVPFPIGTGSYKASFSFEDAWTTDDGLAIRCTDSSGSLNLMYIAPAGVGKLPIPEGYADRFGGCLDGVNFGWRPSSWVPAFFRTTACVAEVLFVPVESDIEALTDGASAASERAPISYIVVVGGEMTGMLSGAPAAVDAGRNGCLTVLGPMEAIDLEAQTACPSTLDGANVTTARSIMGAGSWVLIGLSFFGATRKLIK